MKKLSVEQKAKAYDEAISMAEKFYTPDSNNVNLKATLEMIFPELVESEDEKIRKSLIDMLKNDEKCYLKEIAWLEKQGEQKPTDKQELSKEEYCALCMDINCYGCSYKNKTKNTWSGDDLPSFESYLCLMFQKFRTKGICTNGEIVDFVKKYSQKLKDTLGHTWNKEDEEMWLDTIKYLEIFDAQGIHGNKAVPCINWLKSFKYKAQYQFNVNGNEIIKMLIKYFEDLKERFSFVKSRGADFISDDDLNFFDETLAWLKQIS